MPIDLNKLDIAHFAVLLCRYLEKNYRYNEELIAVRGSLAAALAQFSAPGLQGRYTLLGGEEFVSMQLSPGELLVWVSHGFSAQNDSVRPLTPHLQTPIELVLQPVDRPSAATSPEHEQFMYLRSTLERSAILVARRLGHFQNVRRFLRAMAAVMEGHGHPVWSAQLAHPGVGVSYLTARCDGRKATLSLYDKFIEDGVELPAATMSKLCSGIWLPLRFVQYRPSPG